jgi:DNA-directed RNA polymerase subunit M/transcription elongation factor TFIIS
MRASMHMCAEGATSCVLVQTLEKCMECGHEEMEYTTMQLRSADEGQTVSCLIQRSTRSFPAAVPVTLT